MPESTTRSIVRDLREAVSQMFHKWEEKAKDFEELLAEEAELRRKADAQNAMLRQERDGEVWCWQGDGEDHLESLTCPVLIRPEVLKAMVDECTTAAIRRGDFVEGSADRESTGHE